MQKNEDLARLAYRAYGAVTEFKNYQGLPMPEWANLPLKIQEAWCAAVAAIRDALVPPKDAP